ncbi:hypothetical protein GCM10023168_28500 [Fodinibacter luteus]|uniref:Uncharacterized protein n=1 Tax=Fodinibacter luteus TaxID=552064 RepID=A0ABP8KKT4_9MICO
MLDQHASHADGAPDGWRGHLDCPGSWQWNERHTNNSAQIHTKRDVQLGHGRGSAELHASAAMTTGRLPAGVAHTDAPTARAYRSIRQDCRRPGLTPTLALPGVP